MDKINILKVLRKLNSEKRIPIFHEMGLTRWNYADLLDSMVASNLISGDEKVPRGGIREKTILDDSGVNIRYDSYKIIEHGMDYLEQNRKKE